MKDYMRDYMRKRRERSKEGLNNSMLSPFMSAPLYPNKLSKATVREMNGRKGTKTNEGLNKFEAIRWHFERHGEDIRHLKEELEETRAEIKELKDAIRQYIDFGGRILREHLPEYETAKEL